MAKIFSLLCVVLLILSCENDKKAAKNGPDPSEKSEENASTFGIVIHGGAGTILKENMSPGKNSNAIHPCMLTWLIK